MGDYTEKPKQNVKVLVVDDSRTEQILLAEILKSDPLISVIGMVDNGVQALSFIKNEKPDVITMDLKMPEFDGLQVTRAIMERHPIPIVIVTVDSSLTTAENAFKLMEAGAVAIVEKPFSFEVTEQKERSKQLCVLVRNIAGVKLVHRLPAKNGEKKLPALPSPTKIDCIAIGASTGGPLVLKYLLENLPKRLPVPMFIVQHMSPSFMEGFAHWLAKDLKHPLVVACHEQIAQNGTIYLAPAGFDMAVKPDGKIYINRCPDEQTSFRSIGSLFASVAKSYKKNSLVCLLTGMGNDGANELKILNDLGAITIAQNKETSAVYGMPAAAVKLNAAQMILSPEQILDVIKQCCENH